MSRACWDLASELDPYRDEPAQMASGAVGKNGSLFLEFENRGKRSILSKLKRRLPYFAHRALYWDEALPGLPCVFVITTTGCLLQGDRLHLGVELKEGAQGHLATQSGTQIHSMDANFAAQTQEFVLQEGSYLEYLPDPIFPHARSRFFSKTVIRRAPTATMLMSEILMPGRKYLQGGGEIFEYDLYSSEVRAEDLDGDEKFTEKIVVKPKEDSQRQIGRMGDLDVFGNVYLLTSADKAEEVWARTPTVYDRERGVAAAVSKLPNGAGLVYKVLARESQPAAHQVREFWATARKVVTGASVMKPFLWR